jgi:nucleotide-binding universal stress UspA family protein
MQVTAHVLTFATDFAKANSALLKILLTAIPPASDYFYPFPNDLKLTEVNTTSENVNEELTKLVEDNVAFLKDECSILSIDCEVVRNATKKMVIEASKSSCLLITDPNIDFPDFEIQDILGAIECPAMLVPLTAPKIEKIILAYDGSKSAHIAIEKFMKLFPSYTSHPTHLVTVNRFEQRMLHKEFINSTLRHAFTSLEIAQFEGDEKEEMIEFLRKFPVNTVVVIGGYGRNVLSRLFHGSMTNAILENTRVSVFLAHA